MVARIVSTALLVATAALARTDLQGCTYFDSVVKPSGQAAYATRVWYVPDSGEICEFLDCGGGRAPPKTTVPGCAAYEGTETYSPSFLDPKTLGGLAPETTTTTAAAAVTSETAEAAATEAATTSGAAGGGGDEDEDEGEGDEETSSVEESTGQASQTAASSASSGSGQTATSAASETTTKPAELPSGSGGSHQTPAVSAPVTTSTSSIPDNAGAALTAGAGFGSWVVAAGVVAWAGMI